ncbi:MAG: hypothetical protein AAF213_09560 [Pseudomonadota bacterium]
MLSDHRHAHTSFFGRIILASLLTLTIPLSAAEARSDAEVTARDLGREMAGAVYCGLDPSRIEVLERNFDNRIRGQSESNRDYVQSREVYVENLAKWQRRSPREGCEAVLGRLQSPEQQGINQLNQRMQTLENLTIQQLERLKEQQRELESR